MPVRHRCGRKGFIILLAGRMEHEAFPVELFGDPRQNLVLLQAAAGALDYEGNIRRVENGANIRGGIPGGTVAPVRVGSGQVEHHQVGSELRNSPGSCFRGVAQHPFPRRPHRFRPLQGFGIRNFQAQERPVGKFGLENVERQTGSAARLDAARLLSEGDFPNPPGIRLFL